MRRTYTFHCPICKSDIKYEGSLKVIREDLKRRTLCHVGGHTVPKSLWDTWELLPNKHVSLSESESI